MHVKAHLRTRNNRPPVALVPLGLKPPGLGRLHHVIKCAKINDPRFGPFQEISHIVQLKDPNFVSRSHCLGSGFVCGDTSAARRNEIRS